ncbi:MAG: ethanolamine utilization protein, partial [Burkholderiales bacterium]|nr:ethanolamine utilization protein [Burkholderiales bacterium]
DDAVFDAVRRLLTTPALPARIDPTTMDAIPHAPGVYGFFGEEDVPLYVGRSTDMNARVLSHFSGEHAATKDLQVTRVEWHETIGELEALLLEAGHLRRLDPIHNRRRPGADEPCAFHWDPAVAEAPRLVDGRAVDFDMTGDLFGPFRSPALARRALREIADANNLCHRLAGLERPAPGPCSARVAGRCRGACIDAETPLSHRLRMTTALHRLRMASWPFRGRVGIRETDAAGGRSVIHALDRWRYLGTAKSEHELFDAFERAADIAFDFDTYRILAKWFRQRRGTLDVIDLERR